MVMKNFLLNVVKCGLRKISLFSNSCCLVSLYSAIALIDIVDLMTNDGKNIIVNINESGENTNTNYSNNSEILAKEIENLKNLLTQKDLLLAEKDQRLTEKDRQIDTLNQLVNALKN